MNCHPIRLHLLTALTILWVVPFTPAWAIKTNTVTANIIDKSPDNKLLSLDKGSKQGIKKHDLGKVEVQGFLVPGAPGAAPTTKFQPMTLPLTTTEVQTGSSQATVNSKLPPLIQVQTVSIQTRVIEQTDLQKLQGLSEGLGVKRGNKKSPGNQTQGNKIKIHNQAKAPKAIVTPPQKTVLKVKPDKDTQEVCGANLEASIDPNIRSFGLCLQVSKLDLTVQSVLSGQSLQQVDPATAKGASEDQRFVDDRLLAVARRYSTNPQDPSAALAMGQEYLRFNHPEQAYAWLKALKDPGISPIFSSAYQDTLMYTAFRNEDFLEITQRPQEQDATTYQQHLRALALYRQGSYTQAEEIFARLPATPEVLNNRALNLLVLDQDLKAKCRSNERGSCRKTEIDHEEKRQKRGRGYLDQLLQIDRQNLVAQNNFALLDIRKNNFQSALNRFYQINQQVATRETLDAETQDLKRATLWYINNYQENINYLQREKVPLDYLQTATLGQGLNMLLKGISGRKIGVEDIIGFIALGVATGEQQNKLNQVTEQVRRNFLNNLEYIPALALPTPINLDTKTEGPTL